MKTLITALIATVSLTATAATYVTVTDCNAGESGQQCRTVTYKVRDGQMVQPAQHPQGASSEGEVQYPTHYGVPAWLQSEGGNAPAFPGFEAP